MFNFNKSKYIKGISWFMLSMIISIINDIFMKYLGNNIHSTEITFFRFLFGTISLLPLMIFNNQSSFKTKYLNTHFLRAIFLFFGINLWCFSLSIVPISTATTVNFTIPLITLIFATIFLKEKVGIARWTATLIGFLGVLFILKPDDANNFNKLSLLLLLAAIMFASLDIINKKFIVKESMISMLFYTALITTILSSIPTIIFWKMPTLIDLSILFIIGCGANLLLFCLLKALKYVEASALAPFRYFELILSSLFGFLIFSEIPSKNTLMGFFLIIPSTLLICLYEAKFNKKN